MDAADDWIAERADAAAAVVVTADICWPTAACATVVAPNGQPLITSPIGDAVAVRAIMADLRAGGDRVIGSVPFSKEDRSRFLSAPDAALMTLQRV